MIFVKQTASLLKTYLFPGSWTHMMFVTGVIAVDGALIGCFLLFAWAMKTNDTDGLFYNPLFGLSDGGLIECVGYGLEWVTALAFLVIAFTSRQFYWLCWAAIYVLIFADDAFRLHEQIGHDLSLRFGIPKYSGEVAGFAMMGIAVFALWFAGLLQKPSKGRLFQTYMLFSFYLALLAFFAVFVDALHSFVESVLHWPVPITASDLFEDGGELAVLTLSAITALGFRHGQTALSDPGK